MPVVSSIASLTETWHAYDSDQQYLQRESIANLSVVQPALSELVGVFRVTAPTEGHTTKSSRCVEPFGAKVSFF